MVEAKADDYKAACEEVEFYAKNNNIDKDVVAISISGQSINSYKSGLFLLIDETYKEIETDGKLLPIKDIIKGVYLRQYPQHPQTEQYKTIGEYDNEHNNSTDV